MRFKNISANFALNACLGLFTLSVMLCAADSSAYPSLARNGEYLIERVQTSPQSPFLAARIQILETSAETELVFDSLVAAATSSPQGAIVAFSPAEDRCADIMLGDPGVVSCTPNFVKYLSQNFSDPLMSVSWPLNGKTLLDLHAAQAWQLERGSADVVVAVLDTGVDYTHPDLRNNIWTNNGEIPANGVDDDLNGFIDDVHGISVDPRDPDPMDNLGHGTHVAGIIAAQADNSLGSAGIAPGIKIMPVRFIDENLGTIFDLVKGMNYILAHKQRGVNIVAINASFGAIDFAYPEYHAIKRARDLGVLLVAAAGNESVNNDQVPSYPSNYPLDNIIAVAAVGQHGQLSQFSNYGTQTVHIAAPGEEILSTVPRAQYASFDGTSAATPFVTGAVALVKSYRPNLDYLALRSRVLDYASTLSTLQGLIEGARFLNLYSILSAESPQAIDPNSGLDLEHSTLVNLYAGDARNGNRKVQLGQNLLIVLERAAGQTDYSPVSVELSIGNRSCPAAFRTSVGDDLAVLTTALPSAWKNLRVVFSARNAAGSLTGKDHIRFYDRSGKGPNFTRRSTRRSKLSARLKRICREFVRNTRIA